MTPTPGLVMSRTYPDGTTVTRKVLEAWKYEVKFMELSTETRHKRIRFCTDKEWEQWAKEAI